MVNWRGSALLSGDAWRIAADPDCLMWLKRIFPRIRIDSDEEVRLQRSPEVDRNLSWFSQRFPLEMEPDDLAALHAGAELHLDMARVAAEVTAGTFVARAFELAVPAYDYQRVAADMWLRQRSLLLADDLGAGKTISAIAGLSDPATRPALVVTLAHLPEQWRRELDRFLPGVRVAVLDGTQPKPIDKLWAQQERRQGRKVTPAIPDVLITTYHRIAGWAPALVGMVKSVVYDEVQELRHNDTARYTGARRISAAVLYRLGLSATPIYNYGGEFHNVIQVLRPDALGTWDEFSREWCVAGGEERKARVRDPRAFGLHLREQGIMLRRTRKEVGRELPPLTIVPHQIDADPRALARVARPAAELARLILGANASNLQRRNASGDLDRIVRQATGIAKAPYIAEFVRLLVDAGERPVVYLWHREVYTILLAQLQDLAPAMFTGSESAAAKRESLRRFTARETPVLLMSLRSGVGVDGLQHVSRTAVVGELDWSPVVHDQCIGRLDRPGQPDPVTAYILISKVGSDPIVADVCQIKAAQSGTIRDPRRDKLVVPTVDPERVKQLARAVLAKHGGA